MNLILDTCLKYLAAIAAICVVASPVACTMNQDRLIAQAIAGGTNPVLARCAYSSTVTTGEITQRLCNDATVAEVERLRHANNQ